MTGEPTRQSIEPTYDSRETGPRYHVTVALNDKPIKFMHKIDDPFVTETIHVHWTDLLRGLLRRGLKVSVSVGGDREICDDVLELDADTLVPGSTRRQEFNASLNRSMRRMLAPTDGADDD